MELFVSEASVSGILSSEISLNNVLYVAGKGIGFESSKIAEQLSVLPTKIYPQTLSDISPQQAWEVKYIIIDCHGGIINNRSILSLTENLISIEDLTKDLIDQFPNLECLEIYACRIGDKKALEEYYNIHDLNKDDDRKLIKAKNGENTKTRDIAVIYNAGAKKELNHKIQSNIPKPLPLIKSQPLDQPLKFKEIFLSKLFYPQRAVLTFKGNAYRFGRLKALKSEDISDETITTHIRNTIDSFVDQWNQNNQDNQISDPESFATNLSEKILGFNIFAEGISDEQKTKRKEYFHQYRRANFFAEFERNSIKNEDEITKCLELYEKHNIGVDEKDDFGWTALHAVAWNGHVKVVEKLLEKRADLIDAKINGNNYTALHTASLYGHVEVVEKLLEKKPDLIDAKVNGNNYTALHLASLYGHIEVVEKLLEKGANIEATSNDDWTALHLAAQNGHVEVVEKLLEKGANIEATTNDDCIALHIAAKYGHVKVVEKLLEKRADLIDVKVNDDCTALHLAAQNGHVEVVEKLLEKGAEIEAETEFGRTALYMAAENGHAEVVEKLLERGAAIEATTNDDWTALHIATWNGHVKVVEKLLERKLDLIDAKVNGDWTALHIAAQNGHVEVVEKLLEKRADLIDAKVNGDCTALHLAARNGHVKVVEKLLEKGAAIEAITNADWTALHAAAQSGHIEVVKELLKKWADIEAETSDGFTALQIAEQNGKIDVKELLENYKKPLPSISEAQTTSASFRAKKQDCCIIL